VKSRKELINKMREEEEMAMKQAEVSFWDRLKREEKARKRMEREMKKQDVIGEKMQMKVN
jgi:hypothetical protein